MPGVAQRPEIREMEFRGNARRQKAITDNTSTRTVKDGQVVKFKLPPLSHRIQRKALADARRQLGLVVPGRRPQALKERDAADGNNGSNGR